jgi:PAS domain S-box-containing protein
MAKDQKPAKKRSSSKSSTPAKNTIKTKKKSKPNIVPADLFKLVFNNASIGIILLDIKRNIIQANKYFLDLVKYSEEELGNITIEKITHPDDYKTDEKLFNNLVSGKSETYTIEKRYYAKDGEITNARLTNSLIKIEKQKKIFIISYIEDITKQKQFEEKYLTKRNYLDLLLNNIPDSIYFKDKKSRFLKISDFMAKRLNIQVEDMIGKTDFDYFGSKHAEEAFNDEQNIIKTGIPIINKEEKEDWQDGKLTWVISTKMPFYDENKNIMGTFGISRNITEKKESELTHNALLRISETVFTSSDMQEMFKTIHEVLGTLMPVKNLFIALYDEKRELLAFPYMIDEFDPPFESRKLKKGLTEYVLRTGKPQLISEERDYALREAGEVEMIGTPAKIWLGVPLIIAGKTIGAIVVQDYDNPKAYQEPELQIFSFIAEQIALVIERKRASVEIANYTEELKQLNATKDKFFSIIAHDLKNPFITILGFSELLLSDYSDLTDEEKIYYIEEMKKSSESSHALLQNLLQWSRSQTGFIEFHPRPLNLLEIINQNIGLLESTAAKKEIVLNTGVLPEIEILADDDMINTIIRNLISNAIKFTPRQGTIMVNAEQHDKFVNVSIQDNGRGMTEDVVEKLFRIDVSHTTLGTEKETGSGLGLMLCREFVKKNGGDIWVESKVSNGSKFTFSVPAVLKEQIK